MKVIIPILSLFFLSSAMSSTSIIHRDCKIVLIYKGEIHSSAKKMVQTKLKELNYIFVKEVSSSSGLKSGELYLNFSASLDSGGVFPPCKAVASLFRKNRRKKDKEFFKEEKRRAKPRTTFKGSNRCRLATRDVLESLPRCEANPID